MMKRLLSLLICISIIMSVAPVVVLGDSTDPYGHMADCTDDKKIIDYTFNNDFYETDLAEKVIVESFSTGDDGYKAEYTDDGIVVTKIDDRATSAACYKFAINFVTFDDASDMYKVGLSGVYAFEMTVQPNFTNNKGRTDFFFVSDIAKKGQIWQGPNNNNKLNNFRITPANAAFWYHSTANPTSTSHLADFTNGQDYKLRIVFDTNNGAIYLYDVDSNGEFFFLDDHTYAGEALTSMTWAPWQHVAKGGSFTFKNIKVFELKKNETYPGNTAYETFKSLMPASIVSDESSVTENFEIPSDLIISETTSIESLDEGVLTVLKEEQSDGSVKFLGSVKRGFEDTNAGIKVSDNSNGIYFEKLYKFIVKQREGISGMKLAEYDFSSDSVYNEFVSNVNGSEDSNGYLITNTKETGEIIGLLKTLYDSDDHTNTYYYDNSGAFDYEISLTPDVNDGNALVQVGNYDVVTGNFVPFGTVKIAPESVVYADTKDDIIVLEEITSGNNYDIKFRTYTDENSIWCWVNGNAVSTLPFSYSSTNNTLNAYRVTFENSTQNDSVLLENAVLVDLIASENADLKGCLDVADSIKISDITSQNPDDAYGPIKTLPVVDGYNIIWSTSSALADLENNKYIYRTKDDTEIIISAVINAKGNSKIKVKKDFVLNVKGTDDPQYLLEGDLAKIVPANITNQNPQALIEDMVLPSKSEQGYDVKWEVCEGYENFISVVDYAGKINKNINISEDTEVELKVTISSAEGSISKNIPFVIAKRGADVKLDKSVVTEVVEGVVTYTADVSKTDGSMYIHDGNDNKILSLDIEGSTLKFNNGTEYLLDNDTFSIKVVMNTNDQKLSVFVDDNLVLDYITFAEKAKGFKEISNNGLTLNNEKVIFDEYSLFDYNVKLFDYFDALSTGYIYQNVGLKTDSVGGVNIQWISSNESILTHSGTYIPQNTISNFDVTVKMTVIGSESGACYEKNTKCVAVPTEDNNLFAGATIITNINDDINNDINKGFDNKFGTYFVGKNLDETSYITIDMEVMKDVNAVYFFRDADDTGLKSCDIYSSEDGIEWNKATSATFTGLESNHVRFGLQNARYIKIDNIVTEDGKIKLYEVKAYVSYAADDKAHKDILELNMPKEYELTQSSIILPTVGSVYGSTLVWKSSDESVISTNGTIVKPSGNQVKKVVLTVKATYNGKTSVKSFKYLVPGDGNVSGGGAGGFGGGGNISGVNAGGTTITALPTETEIVQTPSEENLKTEFNDVRINDWYYTYLTNLKNKGIIDGYDDGNFYPNNNITREEFIKLLIVASGLDLSETSEGFKDVGESDWFAPYVYTAKELNIVNGIDDESFGVGRAVSRQDMSVMVYNLIKMKKDVTESKEKFADDSTIADYAINAVYSMKELEILNGYEDGTFNPEGQLTRAEAVKVISLVMNVL